MDIALDVVGLVVPGVPSAGLKVGVRAAEAAYDAYKAADAAHDLSKAADVAITVSKKGDAVLDAVDTAKDTKKASRIAGGGRGGNSTAILQEGRKSNGWHVGDSIDVPTRAGTPPKWSTVRQRYWKNEAYYRPGKFNAYNLARTKRGLAPQRKNPITGHLESKELHHKIPQRENGPNTYENLTQYWPEEHALHDKYRHIRR